MRILTPRGLFSFLLICTVLDASDLPVETIRPEGNFAQVLWEFDVPGASSMYQQWAYYGTLRAGEIRVDHGIGLRSPGGVVRYEAGRLVGRFNRVEGRRNAEGAAEVQLDARVDAHGKVEGMVSIGQARGTVKGQLMPEAELRERNRLDRTQQWPMFLGPVQGGLTAQAGQLADPTDFRLAWRSEEIDIGEGIGSISRFMHTWRDADGVRTSSGSSSPVLADGRIYLSYHVPSPTLPNPRQRRFVAGARPFEKAVEAMAKETGKSPDELPEHVLEKLWEATDDIVLCMDAETGQTLWKSRMPARGYNMQHHKDGPYNMSPAVSDGRVFALGMNGDLYALNAETGALLWSRKIGDDRSSHSVALSAISGVVLVPVGGFWSGLSAETGEDLWRSEIPAQSAAVALWTNGGRTYFLSGTGHRLIWTGQGEDIACLDVLTGEEKWRVAMTNGPAALHSAGRGSGPGGLSVFGDFMIAYEVQTSGEDRSERRANVQHFAQAWRLSGDGAQPLWRVEMPSHFGEHVPVVLHGQYVVLGSNTLVQVRGLQNGRVVSEHSGAGTGPGNGGYMQGMGDLLMVRPDGTHGRPDFHFYRVDSQGQIKHLTPETWKPPYGGGTSSYHHPMYYPMADGRMFLRLADGIYAFDLRR